MNNALVWVHLPKKATERIHLRISDICCTECRFFHKKKINSIVSYCLLNIYQSLLELAGYRRIYASSLCSIVCAVLFNTGTLSEQVNEKQSRRYSYRVNNVIINCMNIFQIRTFDMPRSAHKSFLRN